jgi:putative transposase
MAISPHDRWARFKFSVVGPLLAAPPDAGALREALQALATQTWRHPIRDEPVRFAFSTIERWYYRALHASNPVDALRPGVRNDHGRPRRLSEALAEVLRAQYKAHRHWSYQLHHDNLAARVKVDPRLGPMPSYTTVMRYLKARGLTRTKRTGNERRPGLARARAALDQREVRSYEVEHSGALWHLDFHGSRHVSVLVPDGTWEKPELFAVLDDHSRLCCHAQFYRSESTETLVHGLSQALLKRGLPRAILMDNGGAMLGAELTEGLTRLGILHETTLCYSPHQNGKQEHFWSVVEGRLLAMLDGVTDLTLARLNALTQAWVERDYHRRHHSEIDTTPRERFLGAPDVHRPPPAPEVLRDAFTASCTRRVRRSDATLTLDGVRFEVPARLRHLGPLTLRRARWDLGRVHVVDPRTGRAMARIFPLDRARNARGERRAIVAAGDDVLGETPAEGSGELPPLLQRLLRDYAADGVPPGYLPRPEERND